jgi:hypothetical protein
LKHTRDQGMILRPTGKIDLDLYVVDADFCGLFKHETDSVADFARSRTGYVILLSGFLLIWKSQLQSSIACSTLEAEYTALSYSLKALLPIKRLLLEAVSILGIPPSVRTSVRATSGTGFGRTLMNSKFTKLNVAFSLQTTLPSPCPARCLTTTASLSKDGKVVVMIFVPLCRSSECACGPRWPYSNCASAYIFSYPCRNILHLYREHLNERESQGKSVRPSTSIWRCPSNRRPTNLRLSNQYFVGHTCAPAIPIWRACAPGSRISRDREGTLKISLYLSRFQDSDRLLAH